MAMVAETNFGNVYTNPLLSKVIRYALGLLITFVVSKVIKADAATINVQDYVELSMVVVGSCFIIWHRWKSTKEITSTSAAVDKLLPVLEAAVTPAMREQLLDTLRAKNPALADAVVGELKS